MAQVKLFSGRATEVLAKKIARNYRKNLGKTTVRTFSDGEFEVAFDETIRGSKVFLIQSVYAPLENFFELLMMIDAAKRALADQIIAVIPYLAFARQDRKSKPRVSITAKLMANLLTAAGVDRIVTIDLHSDQIQGFFDIPVDHLYASSIFIPYLKELNLPNLVMASPDAGGAKRSAAYAKILDTDLVMCHKQRSKEEVNKLESMTLIGNVCGKDIVIVDDMIDTAGTITKAADIIMEEGAASVRAICTHPVFSGPAVERIENSSLTEVIVTDTIPLTEIKKVKVLSTATLFADVINRIHNCESISTHFKLNAIT